MALLYEVFLSAQPASGGFFVVSLFMQKDPLAFFYHTPDPRGESKKKKKEEERMAQMGGMKAAQWGA